MKNSFIINYHYYLLRSLIIIFYFRRHYQRYLKAMGINKEVAPPAGGNGNGRQSATPTKSSIETLAAAAVAAAAAGGDGSDGAPNYSSLLDIGQAYGIWAPGDDGGSSAAGSPSAGLDLGEGPRDLKIVEDEADSSQDETNENTPMNEDNDNRDDQVIYLMFFHIVKYWYFLPDIIV